MYTELCREASRWKSRIIPETLVSEARCDNDESRCRSIQARSARCWAGACRMCDLAADRIRLAAAGGGPGMVHRLTGFEQFHTQGRPPRNLGRLRVARDSPGSAATVHQMYESATTRPSESCRFTFRRCRCSVACSYCQLYGLRQDASGAHAN